MIDNNIIDDYLTKPYWIIDILPKQVPSERRGPYFEIEKYFLKPEQLEQITRRYTNLLIKLNCYYNFSVCHALEHWVENPKPEYLMEWLRSGQMLYVVIDSADAMIGFTGDEHYMTLYNPNSELLELIKPLAASEGLFFWECKDVDELV